MQNKYGLNRDIPTSIKRIVRQRCRFGCVICGLWIYQYHHFKPPFAEAKEHNSEGICLLCPNHHTRATKGILSDADIEMANAKPQSQKQGFANDKEFSLMERPVDVFLGAIQFINPHNIIIFETTTLLSLTDDDINRISLNGKFYDKKGELILEIIENEWRAFSENWDVEQVSNRITIKDDSGNVALRIRAESSHVLIVEYLYMFYEGTTIQSEYGGAINIRTKNNAQINNMSICKTSGPLMITSDGSIKMTGGVMMG